jgi:hypothetical protein
MSTNTTIATFIGNASQVDFNFGFDYLRKEFVKVTVEGAEVPFTFHSTQTIKIIPAPAEGDVVIIRRVTDRERLVTFVDGSVLLAGNLNVSQVQTLHIAAEALDAASGSLLIDQTGAYTAGFRRLTNVGEPITANDVVTKEWAETANTSQLVQATTQAGIASAAKVAAEAARDVTLGARDVTLGARDTALGYRDAALGFRNTASSAASTATSGAATATAQAGVAVEKSTEAASQAELARVRADAAEASRIAAASYAGPTMTVSSSPPSGGVDGDIWFQY